MGVSRPWDRIASACKASLNKHLARRGPLGEWQANCQPSAARLRPSGLDASAVGDRDSLDDREAKAGP